MSTSVIVTILIALAIVVFVLSRQLVERPVTAAGLLLPIIVCVLLGAMYLSSKPTVDAVAAVGIGLVFGVGTGLLSGQLIRVWREEASGTVLQRGGWRYLLVIIALLLVRLLIRVVLSASGSHLDETALNAALIAALVGNLLGRDIRVARRALPLANGGLPRARAG